MGDNLFGLQGDDALNGLAQDDCLFGGIGADRLYGAGGDDRLFGDDPGSGVPGRDRLSGNAATTCSRAAPGATRCEAGAGSDRMVGGGGSNRLYGGRGNDSLNTVNGPARPRRAAGAAPTALAWTRSTASAAASTCAESPAASGRTVRVTPATVRETQLSQSSHKVLRGCTLRRPGREHTSAARPIALPGPTLDDARFESIRCPHAASRTAVPRLCGPSAGAADLRRGRICPCSAGSARRWAGASSASFSSPSRSALVSRMTRAPSPASSPAA